MKCFICEAETENKEYLDQILCDECRSDIDDSINRKNEEFESLEEIYGCEMFDV